MYTKGANVKALSKIEFNEVANSLRDSYADFARCLYSEACDEGLTEQIYSYMKTTSNCTTDEVLTHLDALLGHPTVRVEIAEKHSCPLVAA